MIKIEIITVEEDRVTAAFYYPVPDSIYSSNSEDQNRTPAGSSLSAQEVQDLKDGRLYEFMKSGDPRGKSTAQIKAALENMWTNQQTQARNEYISKYSYTGLSWDGSSWS